MHCASSCVIMARFEYKCELHLGLQTVQLYFFTAPFNSIFSHLELCAHPYPLWVKTWQKTLWEKFHVLWAVLQLAFCTWVSSTNLLGVCICKCQPPVRSTKTLCMGQPDMHAQPFLSIKSGITETSKFMTECFMDTDICSQPFYHEVNLSSQQ